MKNLALLFFLVSTISWAQSRTSYIYKKIKTTIVTVNSETYPGDSFLTINIFPKEVDKVDWLNSTAIIEFKYLGNDGQTLFVKRTENNELLNKVEVDELRFKIETGKSTEITLIGQNSQKEPLPIRLQVDATNNSIKAKFIGNLPQYTEN